MDVGAEEARAERRSVKVDRVKKTILILVRSKLDF